MSTQRGNNNKTRRQKHQNKTAFKNNLHDTSGKTKKINSVVVAGVCQHCKDIIDWKIKYKKYKLLSQPRTCIKCLQKTVKQAYYTICVPCAQAQSMCQKCGEQKDIVLQPSLSASDEASRDAMLQFELKQLTERQRRSFFRLQASGKLTNNALESAVGEQDNHTESSHNNSDDEASPSHGNGCHGGGDVHHAQSEESSDGDFSDRCHDDSLCNSDEDGCDNVCSYSVCPDDSGKDSTKAVLR
ncbi:uncharacterized protein LOC135473782 [Liolophura sinensis]|uniref:uncharacterized protein LOC135473782 n=1 Tax=Liolophura sinensis TaxID=3198878 RepID=UPI00315836AE